jgi:hypothetical protein
MGVNEIVIKEKGIRVLIPNLIYENWEKEAVEEIEAMMRADFSGKEIVDYVFESIYGIGVELIPENTVDTAKGFFVIVDSKGMRS